MKETFDTIDLFLATASISYKMILKKMLSPAYILIGFSFISIIHQFLDILQVDFTLHRFDCIVACLQAFKDSFLLAC